MEMFRRMLRGMIKTPEQRRLRELSTERAYAENKIRGLNKSVQDQRRRVGNIEAERSAWRGEMGGAGEYVSDTEHTKLDEINDRLKIQRRSLELTEEQLHKAVEEMEELMAEADRLTQTTRLNDASE